MGGWEFGRHTDMLFVVKETMYCCVLYTGTAFTNIPHRINVSSSKAPALVVYVHHNVQTKGSARRREEGEACRRAVRSPCKVERRG